MAFEGFNSLEILWFVQTEPIMVLADLGDKISNALHTMSSGVVIDDKVVNKLVRLVDFTS